MNNQRHIAISVLIEINQQGAYNNIALRRALDSCTEWQPHQRAFVTELVNGTLRNQMLIDFVIDSFSRKPAAKMKPFIRELLRTAVYQINWMDKVPPSAAVNEAVKLARGHGYAALSGFVNGILRNIVRAHENGGIPMPQDGKGSEAHTRYLSLRYSFPLWLVKLLIDRMGEGAEDFCIESHVPPPVTVSVNPLKTSREALAADLGASGIRYGKSSRSDFCLHLKHVSDITSLDVYRKGHFFVIDEGAYLAAHALSAKPGQNIIDLCAAPGGKSFALAGMMENIGQIISCDIHPHKIRLMASTAKRLGITCINTEERDASIVNPVWDEWADAVLLDVPCSGLGVIRKKPDIKYTKTYKDVTAMAELQRKLLSAAESYVKPGGILVYSTCTVTREENEDNVRWFLDKFPFSLEEERNLSGFFIARMVRK